MKSMLGIIWILSVVLVPIALVIWVKRRQARATQSPEIEAEYLRAGIELKTSGIFGRRLAAGALQGVQFSIEIHPDRGGAAVLSTPAALTGSFAVAKEGDSDRYFKRIGLTSEVQTGDADFDREVYLFGGSSDYLASLFGHRHAKRLTPASARLQSP